MLKLLNVLWQWQIREQKKLTQAGARLGSGLGARLLIRSYERKERKMEEQNEKSDWKMNYQFEPYNFLSLIVIKCGVLKW